MQSSQSASPTNLESKQIAYSPLSLNVKKTFTEQLKTINIDLLKKSLTAVALQNQSFPKKINEKIHTLQLALSQNKNNVVVKSCLESAVKALIDTELGESFKKLLETSTESDIESLNSTFLYSLAKELGLEIQQNPVVQATIQDGKIYWRLLKGDQVIYDHQQSKGINPVAYTKETSWYMDWNSFRAFKDSGKRSSSVVISKELFVSHFREDQNLAGAIWEELKVKGILNSKNKISHAWRVLSNTNVQLTSIDNIRCSSIRKADAKRTLLYNKTKETLYKIANDLLNAKKIIDTMPEAIIFRPESSPKKWAGTGLVLNDYPDDIKNSTKIFHAGVYDELLKHRCSEEEIKKHGENLDYDHVPASATLKNSDIMREYEAEIKKCDEDLAVARSELSLIPPPKPAVAETAVQAAQLTVKTRLQEKLPEDPKVTALKKRIQDNITKKSKLNKAIEIETNTLAFTIAIPHKLHTQGETYLKSAKAQALSTEHPFYQDIAAYMHILETRPEDFKLEYFDDFIKAVGAFRYLYHSQCKPPISPVAGEYQIGRVSHSFFQDAATRKKIDTLFLNGIQSFMLNKEGEATTPRL